jgi:CheY-like chemotaxis protein
LNQWIPPAVEAMRPQAEAKGIDLRHDMPPDRITVDADPERLTQILDNLLRNALTNTDHGAITVTVQRDESHARIAVRDTGTGVDAADVSGLFKPYRQHVGEGATGGLGLGLSLVKALVEAHGGTVSVDSAGRGAGSEFSFTVPLSSAAAISTRGHSAESAASYRVLVVDDERDAADAFGGLLESLGQEVTVVYGAEDALTRAVHRRPRIAFIDLAMPEVDGWELARRLRRTFSREDLTIVAVTGHGKPPAIETIPEVDRYLLKPVSRETVVETLNGVADGRNKPA